MPSRENSGTHALHKREKHAIKFDSGGRCEFSDCEKMAKRALKRRADRSNQGLRD